MDQWTLEEGDGNLKRDPLWRSKANVERIVPAAQQGSVQWYCRYIRECQNIPGLGFEVRKRWLWKDYVNGHFLLRIEEPPNVARSEAGPSVQWALRNKQITCKTWSIVEVPLVTRSCLQLWPKTMSLLQQDLFRFGMGCQKRPRHLYYII